MMPYWKDEKHDISIYHGDCLEVIQELDQTFDVCVADPPYNIGFSYAQYDDSLPHDVYLSQQLELARLVGGLLSNGGSFWYLNYPEFAARFWSAVDKAVPTLTCTEWVTWVYHPHTGGRPLRKASRVWLWFSRGTPRSTSFYGTYRNPNDKRIMRKIAAGKLPIDIDWWLDEQVKNVSSEKTSFPCQVPTDQVRKILYGVHAEKVLDPYLGSGTTLLACLRNGCSGVGIELDEQYCELAASRLEHEIAHGSLW